MRTSNLLASVLILARLTLAQSGLPSCAQSCVNQFTTGSQIGSCGSLDARCICSNSDFLSSIACCLAGACDADDQAAAVQYAKNLCQTQGVTVPDAVSCASASSTAQAATSAASVASSPAASATTSSPVSTASAASVPSAASASPSPSASATKNAGNQNGFGTGLSFAGGLAAMLAVL